MKFGVSFVIILLFAIFQQSYQYYSSSPDEVTANNKDDLYTGPNPEGKPGTPPAPPPVNKPPSDTKTPKTDTGESTTAQDWATWHNNFRKKEKIPDLVWSENIYKLLKPFVTGLIKKPQCETQPFAGMKLQRYGQNAATVYGNEVAQNKFVETILTAWYEEKRFYDKATKNCTNDDLDVCFHFTQLMWKSSKYFACRADTCKNGKRQIAICWYIRPGNCNDRDYTKSDKDSPCGPYLPPSVDQ